MENSPGTSQTPQRSVAQRQVRLRSAVIRVDNSQLERTAQFTDGATRTVVMQWADLQRVAAFRRDVLTDPVLCLAVSVAGNIVVLDESMEGWPALLESLPRHVPSAHSFREWRSTIQQNADDSHWTALFRKEAIDK